MKRILIYIFFGFCCLAIFIFFFMRSRSQKAAAKATALQSTARQKVERVEVIPAARREFIDAVWVQGNVKAAVFAYIPVKMAGVIEEIMVDEGDFVTAGKTALFRTESVRLREQVEIMTRSLEVARCTLLEKEANAAMKDAELQKNQKDYERQKKLLKQGMTPPKDYEMVQSSYLQSQAELKLAQASIALAREQLRMAKANLSIAEKDLQDSTVIAPITGVVSERDKEPGEMGALGTAVLRIDSLETVEISAYLPSEYYYRVVVDPENPAASTHIRLYVAGKDLGELPLNYKSPTIDDKLRIFEIKAIRNNGDRLLPPGAMADIVVILQKKTGIGVPEKAVVIRRGKSAIFTCEDGKAKMLLVQPGLKTDGWTLLKKERIKAGKPIVVSGQTLLDEGEPVKIINSGNQ